MWYNCSMKKTDLLKKEPEVEFYLIIQPNKEEQVVSAIGYDDGGYVYLSLPIKINNFDSKEKIKISKISNIVEFCGDPNVKIFSIDKEDPKINNLYFKLLDCLKTSLEVNEKDSEKKNYPEKM